MKLDRFQRAVAFAPVWQYAVLSVLSGHWNPASWGVGSKLIEYWVFTTATVLYLSTLSGGETDEKREVGSERTNGPDDGWGD
jgi:hypothetical protein